MPHDHLLKQLLLLLLLHGVVSVRLAAGPDLPPDSLFHVAVDRSVAFSQASGSACRVNSFSVCPM
jgi:hypothetical protein